MRKEYPALNRWWKLPEPKEFPSDEVMEKLLDELKMRNNPMYQEDCAHAWFAGELKSLNITADAFTEWYEKRQTKCAAGASRQTS